METLKQSTIVAKKVHACDWCGLNIEKGETYERCTCVHDGVLYDWKNHISCKQIASKLEMFDYTDEGVTGDDFKENVTEKYNDLTKDDDSCVRKSFAEKLEYVKNFSKL